MAVGDYTQADFHTRNDRCGNASIIELDFLRGRILVISSVVGLPPVFYGNNRHLTFVSSPFLPDDVGMEQVDIEGVADTLRWGYPLDGRTIIANIRCVPANARATITVGRPVVIETLQDEMPPASDRHFEPCDLIEAQTAAFLASVRRMPISGAFMSLSGGLDSRTALVALLKEDRRIPCVSIAGSVASHDARIAKRFCNVHGLAHETVLLGSEFNKSVPDAVVEAAGITGGVGCLNQTVDLYLYKKLGMGFSARVSGNLGNQVARGGIEGFGTASVCEALFGQELRVALERRPVAYWLIPRIRSDGFAESLFGQEVPYSSVANYMLGSGFALQLTPYADARVIMLAKNSILRNSCFRNITEGDFRKRDLMHRLFGPPREQSFQRVFLETHDLVGSQIPLNWGWHVNGEWSLRSRVPPLCYIADAFVLKLARTNSFAAPLAGISRYLGHPSAFVLWPDVLRSELKPILYDVLLSQKIRESGLFDSRALRSALDGHFSGRESHYVAICRAFEVALGLTVRVMTKSRPRSACG